MPVNLINRFRISKALICLSLGLIVAAGVLPSGAKTKIVSFKDAAKLKTWDADDARSAQKWEEMRCVTREKLETLDLGLEAHRFLSAAELERSLREDYGLEF